MVVQNKNEEMMAFTATTCVLLLLLNEGSAWEHF